MSTRKIRFGSSLTIPRRPFAEAADHVIYQVNNYSV
jgi:hypothetical protein